MVPFFDISVFIIWGACLGSFTTAYSHRVQHDKSWAVTRKKGVERSCCPQCHNQLKWSDLVPVLSWLIMRGRCRYCQKPISIRYLFIELFFILIAIGAYRLFGFSAPSFFLMASLPFLYVFLENLVKRKWIVSALVLHFLFVVLSLFSFYVTI